MKPGHKFLAGAALIVGSVALLMVEGVKEFGQYSLTPSELAAKTAADSSFYNLGLKMNAKVVPGTIKRDAATQTIDFQVTDGSHTYPVSRWHLMTRSRFQVKSSRKPGTRIRGLDQGR